MKIFLSIFLILIVTSCSENKRAENCNVSAFSLPIIPLVYKIETQRLEFLAANYWINFNFQDTVQLRHTKNIDQLFIGYIDVLSQVSSASAVKAIRQMISKAETDSNVYASFVALSERHLYDPNSPVRNEPLYMIVLENILASDKLDKGQKTRYQARYELGMKNRQGENAADFNYSLIDGRKSKLYNIKSAYVLLFFNNPDCDDCKNVKQQIVASLTLRNLQQNGKLKILSLYPDKNLDIWHQNQSLVPPEWINAYDSGAVIEEKSLYDLKAIPTLYLLNQNKLVLLKDARFDEIENYLQKISQL